MIEFRSTLIDAGRGRVRVLRLCGDGLRCNPLRYTVALNQAMCRVCGCVSRFGCAGGCAWVTAARDLCSRCADRIAR